MTDEAAWDALPSPEEVGLVPDPRIDRIVRVAQRIFEVPIVAVNMLVGEMQYTRAALGTDVFAVPAADSICAHAVRGDRILEVHDLCEDDRFSEHPFVTGMPYLRFYAGAPIRTPTGQPMGALCIMDHHPRTLGDADLALLQDLADITQQELSDELDLSQAGTVQQSLLPRRKPDLAGVDVAGRMIPARNAGGDFFDWQVIDTAYNVVDPVVTLQVLVSDVMGKGLPAALVASGVHSDFRAHSAYVDLGRAFHRTATDVAEPLGERNSFVTMWAGRLDPHTGDLSYIDAGHGSAVIISPRGLRLLQQGYLPLGIATDERYEPGNDRLETDEFLVVVSDGVLDLFPTSADVLEAVAQMGPATLPADVLVQQVIDFTVSQSPQDDVTVLVLRRTEEPG